MGTFATPDDRYAAWDGSVPKWEITDPVEGGAEDSSDNKVPRALHRRIEAVMQQLSDGFGADLRDSSVRAHARKAAELYRLFGNRMLAGTEVTSPAAQTVRVPSSARILVGGYWFEPAEHLEKDDLPTSDSGGLYLHRTGFDPATHRPVFALVTGGSNGVAEFTWTNGVRSVSDPDRFFLCNWSTDGLGVVTVTHPAKPLDDDALALPIGMPVPRILKGSADELPPNWRALDGGTVSEPRSPFHGVALPDMSDRFIRGASSPAQAGAVPAGGSNTHNHGGATGTNPTTATPGQTVIENNVSVVAGGAINNHLTAHTHPVSSANNIPAYRGMQIVMRIY